MTAGIFAACGAIPAGEICGPTPWNEKGQFENRALVNNVIKPYLSSIGCDPMGQWPLPETAKCTPDPKLRQKMVQHMGGVEFDLDGNPWFLKGAKFCLIWPAIHAAWPEAKWIVTQRDDKGIIDSCLKAPFMKAFKDRQGWQGWIEAHNKKFDEMVSAGLDTTIVNTADIARGEFLSARRAVEYCGLTWNPEAVGHFVDKNLWHN
jgi:hypothetical protein